MKYSVIIPAYNAETTLRRCMDSIVSQLTGDSEVLLINDGSIDGTEEICLYYSEQYPGVKLISKPNGGVSSARNMGLDAAKGEYILFVDSDDAVRSDYFSVLDEALKCSPDMLLFKRQYMDKSHCLKDCCASGTVYEGVNSTSRFLSKCLRRQELNLITTKAFKRKIVEEHGIRFDERLDIGEDKAFALAFSLYAEKVKTIPNRLYYLSLEVPDSLSRRKRDKLCESVMLEHRLMADMLKGSDIPEDCKKRYRSALSYSFYRSAYTVVGELHKYDLAQKDRKSKAREYLEAYSKETALHPEELSCKLISFPVRKKDAVLIDGLMSLFPKRGGL